MRRFHAHLRVDDLQSSVRFYSMLCALGGFDQRMLLCIEARLAHRR
jgi:hypothetical protein